MSIIIRRAEIKDAEIAVLVLRESISILCKDDHQDDPNTLEKWLKNKTVDVFIKWLNDPEKYVIVAVDELQICGVGLINHCGDLDLCYVKPGMQKLGIGKAMVNTLELKAREWGIDKVRLIATFRAREFYEKMGYIPDGQPVKGPGMLWDYNYIKIAQQGDAPEPVITDVGRII